MPTGRTFTTDMTTVMGNEEDVWKASPGPNGEDGLVWWCLVVRGKQVITALLFPVVEHNERWRLMLGRRVATPRGDIQIDHGIHQ